MKQITIFSKRIAELENPRLLSLLLMNCFVKFAGIDLSEAEKEKIGDYKNIQEIFTRKLKPNSRTAATESDLVIFYEKYFFSNFSV